MDVALRTRDPRWHCERTFELSLGEGKADIFFIDTSPFIEAYYNYSWAGQLGKGLLLDALVMRLMVCDDCPLVVTGLCVHVENHMAHDSCAVPLEGSASSVRCSAIHVAGR